MMPSRGASVLRGIVPHVRPVQHRSFSIAPRRQHLLITRHRPHLISAVSTLTPLHLARNASTAPLPAPPTSTPPATPPAALPDFSSPAPSSSTVPNLDSLSLENIDFSSQALAGVEKIGYLKELGIEYGWGATSSIQWLVEHLHLTLDLPWWGAIASAAVIVRLVTLPLTVRASETAARVAAMKPVTNKFTEQIKQARLEGNNALIQSITRDMWAANSAAGISQLRILAPIVVQGWLGYCGYRLMRNMATLPVPGLRDGGMLWFNDLTMSDGYLLLPLMMAASMHMMIRIGSETGATTQLPGGFRTFMLYGMPTIIFLVVGWQPAALCVWFASSGALSMLTGFTLKNKTLRKLLGMTPFYDMPASAGPQTSMFDAVAGISQAAAPVVRTGHMRPTYQAPTLNQTGPSGSKTIDTTLLRSSASPAVKSPGWADGIKESFNTAKQATTGYQQKQADKGLQKKRAAAHEDAIARRRIAAKGR